MSGQGKNNASRQQGARRKRRESKGAKEEWKKEKTRGMLREKGEEGGEGERRMAVYGSLCHSGFMLAAQFDEGKGGRKQRPRRQTTPRCRGEAVRRQTGSFWLHSFPLTESHAWKLLQKGTDVEPEKRERKSVEVNTDWSGLQMEQKYKKGRVCVCVCVCVCRSEQTLQS